MEGSEPEPKSCHYGVGGYVAICRICGHSPNPHRLPRFALLPSAHPHTLRPRLYRNVISTASYLFRGEAAKSKLLIENFFFRKFDSAIDFI